MFYVNRMSAKHYYVVVTGNIYIPTRALMIPVISKVMDTYDNDVVCVDVVSGNVAALLLYMDVL